MRRRVAFQSLFLGTAFGVMLLAALHFTPGGWSLALLVMLCLLDRVGVAVTRRRAFRSTGAMASEPPYSEWNEAPRRAHSAKQADRMTGLLLGGVPKDAGFVGRT